MDRNSLLSAALAGLTGILLTTCSTVPASAQTDVTSLIGEPPHARILPVRFGQANLDTGDLHLEIPLYSAPERGLAPSMIRLVYDSLFWHGTSDFGTNPGTPTFIYPTGTGWSIQSGDTNGAAFGVQSVPDSTTSCSSQRYGDYGNIVTSQFWYASDTHGTQHRFNLYTAHNNCTFPNGTPDTGTSPQSSGGQAYALDGSGYHLTVASDGVTASVISPDGSAGSGITTSSGSTTTFLNGDESPNGNVAQFSTYLTSGSGPVTNYDELGAQQYTWSNSQNSCLAPDGSTLGITMLSQVASDQPYPSNPPAPVTCIATMPAWDGATQSATTAQYTFVYDFVPVCSAFYQTQGADYCGGMWELQSVTLPGGLGEYRFGYDNGASGTHLGLLTSITLPTSGTVSYKYGSGPNGTVTNITPFITSVSDLGGTTTISYTGTGSYPYPETIMFPPHPATPGGTQMIQDHRTISGTGYGGTYSIQDYSGNTLLQTTVDTRDSFNRVTTLQTTWNATGETHTVTYKYADDPTVPGYQNYGPETNMIGQESEYDSGTLVRTLSTQYIKDTSSIPYVSQYNMIDYPLSQTLTDGKGNVVAQTLYSYDEYSASYCQNSYPAGLSGIPMLTSVVGASGHDDSRGTSYLARGNVTTIQNLVSPGVYVTTHKCYDTLGNVLQDVDGNGKATRYSYADNFLDTACISAGANTHAFPTLVTDALGHQTKTGYYTCSRAAGQVQTPNDLANGRTGTTTTYDVAGRPLCVSYPDGGGSCSSYPSETEVDTTTSVDAQNSDATRSILDNYGRATTQIDTVSGVEVDTTYDALGHVNSVSNPYVPGSASTTTNGTTYYAYDVLGRTTGILYQDGKSLQTNQYSGNTVTVTDPAGNQRKIHSDALGRTTTVWETDGSSQTPSMETDYSYDVLNNLKGVTQWGGSNGSSDARSRSFYYDDLSRLTQAYNPETGWTCYGTVPAGALPNGSNCTPSYDGSGNLTAKTDARGITTSYSYDALNRLLSMTYSTNDPAATPFSCYQYDSSGVTNGIGRLAAEWTQRSSSGSCGTSAPSSGYAAIPTGFISEKLISAYDSMGRVKTEKQCTPSTCNSVAPYQLTYNYDLAGNTISYSNGLTNTANAITFTQSFTPNGWLQTVSSSLNDCLFQAQSSTVSGSPCTQTTSAPPYSPNGALQNAYLGSGVSLTQLYDSRLRIKGATYKGAVAAGAASGSATVTIFGQEQTQ